MSFRILKYLVRVWDRWLRDHPGIHTLPVVLPVLLHHGDGRWQAAPDLASMLDGSPELLDAVRPYQPHFRFVLDDLAALSLETLASRTLDALGRLVQVAGSQGAEDVVNAGEQLIEQGRAQGIEQGLRTAITHVLAARALPVSELGRARLASCADVVVLTTWLERAATAGSEADVFAG